MLLALLRTHGRLKLLLTVVLNAVFWSGYGLLGHVAFFPLRAVPLTPLDRLIPFRPEGWGWVYFSQYVFTAALPWLLTSQAALRRYARGVLLMAAMAFAVFLFLPTPGPRPVEVGATFPMRVIAACDGPLNACPSLHAAFIAYMGALAWRMFGRTAPGFTLTVTLGWSAAILYSTLATKQHYALDLLAGGAIGALADWLAWRTAPSDAAAINMPPSSGSRSQPGVR